MKSKEYRLQMATVLAASLVCLPVVTHPAQAEVQRVDQPTLASELKIPIYHWVDREKPTQGVIVAMHGATLHGGAFDRMARELADRGYEVFAPDMRGFGRWYLGDGKTLPGGQIAYYRSREDVVSLLLRLREQYKDKPIYCLGESLGANMALWVASVHPDLVDAIVVASPCGTRRSAVCSTFVADFAKFWLKPKRNIPLEPYAKRFLSEEPEIVKAYLNDPGNRKTMTFWETMQSFHANKSSLMFLEQIPSSMPVLVLIGEKDRMYKASAAREILDRIPSHQEQLISFKDRGHIHLETPFIKQDVITSLSDWLNQVTTQKMAQINETPQMSVSGKKL
ncbi:MAG TPA: alpha/beta fold hydrolase [Candidatus Obscuribacterales bacterium]